MYVPGEDLYLDSDPALSDRELELVVNGLHQTNIGGLVRGLGWLII